MTGPLYLRGAVDSDVDLIFRWRRETAAWLAATFRSDQWSTPYPRERIEMWVAQGATVMAAFQPTGPAVATITTSPDGSPDLWTRDELQVPARYLAKANVAPAYRGNGIGVCLIEWAGSKAAQSGADLIRLDAWSTNLRLQRYYRRLGFRYLRTVPGTVSGALFERPASATHQPQIVEMDDVRVV